MKTFIFALVLSVSQLSFACSGCKMSGSKGMAANIQASNTASQGSATGMRILAGKSGEKAFKNDKVFQSVGKPQDEIDPNWTSTVSE